MQRRVRKQVAIHKGVWKAHFGAVDGAIASAFDDSEDIAVSRVKEEALDRRLFEDASAAQFLSDRTAWPILREMRLP